MEKKITKAVIPAAGLGTRMLPISRTVPKEVLPVVDRPVISYLVEEAADSGITDLLIITGRSKTAIEDYFDYSPEYEQKLIESGHGDQIEEMREICKRINVYFIRQLETKGLGHAIGRARAFTGNEPFAVLYGDDLIFSDSTPVTAQLIDAYNRYNLPIVGVKEVPDELVMKYCTLDAKHVEGRNNEYNVYTMIEKPKREQIITNLSILGRVILTREVYDIIDNTPPGAGGEIQLTDTMKTLAETYGMIAVDFDGKRYDLGSKLGFLYANVDRALKDPKLGEPFREYIKEIAKKL